MNYAVLISKTAQKSLDRINFGDRQKLSNAIIKLGIVPRPNQCKKLSGREAWRIRVGDYRIIYEIHDDKLIVVVVVVGHRREVYR